LSYKLKIDLHIHSREDVAEQIYGHGDLLPAIKIIDLAIQKGFDAIALTHHGLLFKDQRVWDYARERGLLLIPGLEAVIEKKHVLLINFTLRKHILSFAELSRNLNDDMLVIAPHPYYLSGSSLGDKLEDNIDLFDAIEYCHYYYRCINPNSKALKIAEKYNLPLVGNSDMHHPMQFGTTYSYVHSEERSIAGIVDAIKSGRVQYISHNLSLVQFYRETSWIFGRISSEIKLKANWHLKRMREKVLG